MSDIVIKNRNKGFSAWSAVQQKASSSSLFNNTVFNTLDVPHRESYLFMLAANGEALQSRIPSSLFYSASAMDQYNILSFASELLDGGNFNANQKQQDETYENNFQSNYDKALEEEFNAMPNDKTVAGYVSEDNYKNLKYTIDTNYGGNVVDFFKSDMNIVRDPSVELDTKEGSVARHFANQKDLKNKLNNLKQKAKDTAYRNTALSYTKLLEAVALNTQYNLRKDAFDKSSFWEKFGSSIVHVLTVPISAAGNMIEGVIDGTASFAGLITGAEDEAKQFIGKDLVSIDTFLADALPNSYATSEFTSDWHPAKISYNATSALSEIGVMIGLNAAMPGLGTGLYYGSMYGNTLDDTIHRNPGMSLGKNVLYSGGSTLIEMGIERISGNKIFGGGLFSKWEKLGSKSIGFKLLKETLGEGFEEVLSGIGSSLWYSAITGEKVELNVEELAYSALLGGIIGLVGAVGDIGFSSKIAKNIETQVKGTAGNVIKLNKQQAYMMQSYLTRLDEKVKAGGKLSEKELIRHTKLKSLRVYQFGVDANDILSRPKEQRKALSNMRGTFFAMETLSSKQTEAKLKDADPSNVESKDITELYKDVMSTSESDITEAANEAKLILTLEGAKILKKLGNEKGKLAAEAYLQHVGETIDAIIETAEAVPSTESGAKTAKTVANEAFKTSDITIIEKNDIAKTISSQIFGKFNKKVFIFSSTNNAIPNVFVYNNKIFISNKVIGNQTNAVILEQVAANIHASEISKLLPENVIEIFEKSIAKLKVEGISKDMQIQQLVYLMLFVEDNDLSKNMFLMSKESMSIVKKYLEEEYKNSVATYETRAISQAKKVHDKTILQSVKIEGEQGAAEAMLTDQATPQFIEENKKQKFDPLECDVFSIKLNVPEHIVDMQNAINYFKSLGFKPDTSNGALTVEQEFKQLTNIKNYKNPKKVMLELDKYSYPEYDIATKSYKPVTSGYITERLNLLLSDKFNFQIASDGTLIHQVEINKMINFDKLEKLFEKKQVKTKDGEYTHYTINNNIDSEGFVLYDFMTDEGKLLFNEKELKNTRIFFNDTINYDGNNGSGFVIRTSNGHKIVIKSLNNAKFNEAPLVNINGVKRHIIFQTTAHEIGHVLSNISGLVRNGSYSLYTQMIENIVNTKDHIEVEKAAKDFLLSIGVSEEKATAKAKELIAKNKKAIDTFAMLIYNHCSPGEMSADGMALAYANSKNLFTYSEFKDGTVTYSFNKSSDPFLALFADQKYTIKNRYNVYWKSLKNALANKKIMATDALKEVLNKEHKFGTFENEQLTADPVTIDDFVSIFIVKPKNETDLLSKEFWMQQTPEVAQYILENGYDTNYFIKLMYDYTGNLFDPINQVFVKSDIDLQDVSQLYTKFNGDNDFNGIIKDNEILGYGNLLFMYTQFNKGDIEFIYNKDKDTATIILNENSINSLSALNQMVNKIPNAKADFIINGKVFETLKSAQRYLNTDVGVTKNANFNHLLYHGILNTSLEGYNKTYPLSTLFLTNDGKVYNTEFSMEKYKSMVERFDMPTELLGDYTVDYKSGEFKTTGEENITLLLANLLDEAKIVRAYKDGEKWQVFGKPNILQDKALASLPVEDIEVFVEEKRSVIPDFEYGLSKDWRGKKWYNSLIEIMQAYNLSDVSQLTELGFSNDFINLVTNSTNKKTGKHSGINLQDVLMYINDYTVSERSKDILIKFSPYWRNNKYIKTVADVERFNMTICQVKPFLKEGESFKTFDDALTTYINEINSPTGRELINNELIKFGDAQEKGISYMYTSMLNMDAGLDTVKQTPGLDISLDSYYIVYKALLDGRMARPGQLKNEALDNFESTNQWDETSSLSVLDKTPDESTSIENTLDSKEKIIARTLSKIDKVNEGNPRKGIQQYKAFLNNPEVTETLRFLDDDLIVKYVNDQIKKSEQRLSKLEKSDEVSDQEISTIYYLTSLEKKLNTQSDYENENDFTSLNHSKKRYVKEFGEEGYKQIREMYTSKGFAKRYNIRDYISKNLRTKRAFLDNFAKKNPNAEGLDILNKKYQTIVDMYEDLKKRSWKNEKKYEMHEKLNEAIKLWGTPGQQSTVVQLLTEVDNFIDSTPVESKTLPILTAHQEKFMKNFDQVRKKMNNDTKYAQWLAKILIREEAKIIEQAKGKSVIYHLRKQLDDLRVSLKNEVFLEHSLSDSDFFSELLETTDLTDTEKSELRDDIVDLTKSDKPKRIFKNTRENYNQYMKYTFDRIGKKKAELINSPAVDDAEVSDSVKKAADMLYSKFGKDSEGNLLTKKTIFVKRKKRLKDGTIKLVSMKTQVDTGTGRYYHGIAEAYFDLQFNPKTERALERFLFAIDATLTQRVYIDKYLTGNAVEFAKEGDKFIKHYATQLNELVKLMAEGKFEHKEDYKTADDIKLDDKQTQILQDLEKIENEGIVSDDEMMEAFVEEKLFDDIIGKELKFDDKQQLLDELRDLQKEEFYDIIYTLENLPGNTGAIYGEHDISFYSDVDDFYRRYPSLRAWVEGIVEKTSDNEIIMKQAKEESLKLLYKEIYLKHKTGSYDNFLNTPMLFLRSMSTNKIKQMSMNSVSLGYEIDSTPNFGNAGDYIYYGSILPSELKVYLPMSYNEGIVDSKTFTKNEPIIMTTSNEFIQTLNNIELYLEEKHDFSMFMDDDLLTKPEKIKEEQPKKERKIPDPKVFDTPPEYTMPEKGREIHPTNKSKLLTNTVKTMLGYQFRETKLTNVKNSEDVNEEVKQISSAQFVIDNGKLLSDFLNNTESVANFLTWIEKGPALTFASDESFIAQILIGQIRASLLLPQNYRQRANKLLAKLKHESGVKLALGGSIGLTPIDQIAIFAENSLNLSKEEMELITKAAQGQKVALQNGQYTHADKFFAEVLKIIEKHESEMPVRYAMWEKGIDKKERIKRVHNWLGLVDRFRYFSMLSTPATFLGKNIVGNYIAKAMDMAASTLSAQFIKLFKNNDGYTIKTGRDISDGANAITEKMLVKSGLIDAILNNSVTKYETGFAPFRAAALGDITDFESEFSENKKQGLNAAQEQVLFGEIRKRRLFQKKNKINNILNTYYNAVFDTMNAGDKIFLRKDIINKTKKIISDNFTEVQLKQMLDGTDPDGQRKIHDIIDFAKDDSLEIYFRSSPTAYKALMKLLGNHPNIGAIFRMIFPFARMLINSTMTAIKYSPVGFANYVSNYIKSKDNPSLFTNIKLSKDLGKAATGTLMMGLGAILAALKVIRLDEEEEYLGPQLYLFDVRINLNDLAPTTIPFVTGAIFALANQEGIGGQLKATTSLFLESILVGDLMSMFEQGKDALGITAYPFQQFVFQLIPSVLKNAAKIIDPHKKDIGGQFLRRFAAALPGVSYAIPNKIDPYTGEDLSQNNSPILGPILGIFNLISPMKTYYDIDSTVEKESMAVDAKTTGPSSKFIIKGEEIQIEGKELEEYKKLRAKLYSQYATELIKTERYQKMTIDQKKELLKKLQTRATQEARISLSLR